MKEKIFKKDNGTEYDLNFSYRITTKKLYLNKTGRNLNEDLTKVLSIFNDAKNNTAGLKDGDIKTVELSLSLMLSDEIVGFLVDVFPCLYVDNDFNQNEKSYLEFKNFNLDDEVALNVSNVQFVADLLTSRLNNANFVKNEKKTQ